MKRQSTEIASFQQFVDGKRLIENEVPKQIGDVKISGSGSLVSPNGYVLTANHLLEPTDTVKVFWQKTLFKAKPVLRLPSSDVLLLRLETTATDLPFLELDQSSPTFGERLFGFGFPAPLLLGFYPKYHETTVSSHKGLGGEESSFQVALDSGLGSSGMSLVNSRNKIVGVVSSMLHSSPFLKEIPSNISFAANISSIYQKLKAQLPVLKPSHSATTKKALVKSALSATVLVLAYEKKPTAKVSSKT